MSSPQVQPGSVLDASALLAWLQGETGADIVDEAVKSGALIHAVNWAEVLSKLAGKGVPAAEAARLLTERGILGQLLAVDLGTIEDAQVVGDLSSHTRSAGLSLGDRYCLALAQRHGAPALTADRAWQDLRLGVSVQVVR